MSGDISRETLGDATEGVPGKLIYTAFLGVTLCAFGIYGGLYLLHGATGWLRVTGGILVLVVSVGVAASFVALLTGAAWALVVCRVFLVLAVAALAAGLAWALTLVVRSPEWNPSGAKLWRVLLETTLDPTVLMPLAGLTLTVVMTCFLFGRNTKRFFSR
ncbi:MAG TPA: hypothetical protein VMZ92_14355 [Planctomycetota bacterium]|nr:hypothetical protein [Planctomycetota bacterium]